MLSKYIFGEPEYQKSADLISIYLKGTAMKLFGTEGMLLMEVEAISAEGKVLLIQGKMMGQIPMKVVVQPGNLREALGLLSVRIVLQAIKMLFTKGK